MIIEIKQFSMDNYVLLFMIDYKASLKMMVDFIEYPHKINEESVLR